MRTRQSGFGFVELIATVTFLAIGVMAFVGNLASFSRISTEVREHDVCAVAARAVYHEIRKVGFSAIPANFGSGTAKQYFFCDDSGAVVFSEPAESTASGEIEVFDIEDDVPVEFGGSPLGYDLNGDGDIDSGVVKDYVILPVRMTLSTGRQGEERDFVLHFFLTENY
ncbi:MAG: hypothetical protein L0Z55_04055 [Planctomycetes bacterium]|nr:hypothetical protein [Planctomycetota bacterium]